LHCFSFGPRISGLTGPSPTVTAGHSLVGCLVRFRAPLQPEMAPCALSATTGYRRTLRPATNRNTLCQQNSETAPAAMKGRSVKQPSSRCPGTGLDRRRPSAFYTKIDFAAKRKVVECFSTFLHLPAATRSLCRYEDPARFALHHQPHLRDLR